VPGIYDGAFGSQVVFNYSALSLELDLVGDEKKIIELVVSSKRLGALIIGGGISKHHTIWWAQLREGLDYAVYITTAVEYDGSLSGAQPREAISWGKLKPTSKHVVVYGDATVLLPIIVTGALCKLEGE
jgi:deoxyhypusine synthase